MAHVVVNKVDVAAPEDVAAAVATVAPLDPGRSGIGPVPPEMGYSERQPAELEGPIRAVPCDVVVVGTPVPQVGLLALDDAAAAAAGRAGTVVRPGVPTLRYREEAGAGTR